jgi:hypothetical protein
VRLLTQAALLLGGVSLRYKNGSWEAVHPPCSETRKSQISRQFRESLSRHWFRDSPYFPPRPLRPSWSCWCTAPGLCSHWAVAACNHRWDPLRRQITVISLKLQRQKSCIGYIATVTDAKRNVPVTLLHLLMINISIALDSLLKRYKFRLLLTVIITKN